MYHVFHLRFKKYIPYIVLLFLIIPAIMYLYLSAQREVAAVSLDSAKSRPTLIIDAGHGGLDGGAVAPDGTTEAEVNLAVALRMRDLCALYGVSHLMTRDSAEIVYPPSAATIRAKKAYDTNQRLELIHSVSNAVLLSVHQNQYSGASPRGAQALYGAGEQSKAFGELLQTNLYSLWPENQRTATQIADSIYLMREAGCTAVLVECGFLSNPEEARLLAQDNYRSKIAAVLIGSFLQFTADGSFE